MCGLPLAPLPLLTHPIWPALICLALPESRQVVLQSAWDDAQILCEPHTTRLEKDLLKTSHLMTAALLQ